MSSRTGKPARPAGPDPTRLVLPETRAALQRHLPGYDASLAHARLTEHLLFTPARDTLSAEPIVDHLTVGGVLGLSFRQARQRNTPVLPFLQQYARDVLPLDISSPSYRWGQAWADFPGAVRDAVAHELHATSRERQECGVHLFSGARPDARRLKTRRNQERRALAASLPVPAEHPASGLLAYLNAQPTVAIERLVARNIDAAREQAGATAEPAHPWRTTCACCTASSSTPRRSTSRARSRRP